MTVGATTIRMLPMVAGTFGSGKVFVVSGGPTKWAQFVGNKSPLRTARAGGPAGEAPDRDTNHS